MPEIYITWYDEYDYPKEKESRVYFVDDNKNFHWVSTDDCKLLKETKH